MAKCKYCIPGSEGDTKVIIKQRLSLGVIGKISSWAYVNTYSEGAPTFEIDTDIDGPGGCISLPLPAVKIKYCPMCGRKLAE